MPCATDSTRPPNRNRAMLTQYDLERMAEEMGLDRSIGADLFCSPCGYSLRGLPYRGRCPECGSDYDAKSLWKEGVISAGCIKPPFGDYFQTGLLMIAAVLPVVRSISSSSLFLLVVGAVLFACTLVCARRAWIKTVRFIHIRRMVRQIEDEQSD